MGVSHRATRPPGCVLISNVDLDSSDHEVPLRLACGSSSVLADPDRDGRTRGTGGVNKIHDRIRTHRSGNEKTLASVTVLALKSVELVYGVDSFGDRFKP
jgi:hypothetical protein